MIACDLATFADFRRDRIDSFLRRLNTEFMISSTKHIRGTLAACFIASAAALSLLACAADAQRRPPRRSPQQRAEADHFAHDEPAEVEVPAAARASAPLPEPEGGRGIATMNPTECTARVRALGLPVEFTSHSAVDSAVIPNGLIGGISLEFTGRRRLSRIMDCRLLLAIHAWAPRLRALGVRRIRHLSALRPGARVRTTGRASGHARALAFDPRFFDFDDGHTFDILEDWDDRQRGANMCEPKSESEASAEIRAAVCAAIAGELFQVVVSPHHNDAHQNHLHLEVVPGAPWQWTG
jgi:hypothetical protein